jgi:hypothetical protein
VQQLAVLFPEDPQIKELIQQLDGP